MPKRYAQIDATGICVAVSDLAGEVNAAHMIEVADDAQPMGQKWTGKAWAAPAAKTKAEADKEAAQAELARIDAETGMPRALREALLIMAAKSGAELPFLDAQEVKAAAARGKLA